MLPVALVVDMGVLYVAVAVGFREPRDWLVLAGGLAFGLAIAVGYALVRRVGGDPVGWSTDAKTRPFSTLGNADMFAHLLSVAFAVALSVAASRAASGRARSASARSFSRWFRW